MYVLIQLNISRKKPQILIKFKYEKIRFVLHKNSFIGKQK